MNELTKELRELALLCCSEDGEGAWWQKKILEILSRHEQEEQLEWTHIGFSDRLLLESRFIAWAKDNGAVVCPSSVLCWAQSKGLLNTAKARKYLMGLEDKHNG